MQASTKQCDGLNENVPQAKVFEHFSLQLVALLEVHHRGQALRVCSFATLPVCSFSFYMLVVEDVNSLFPVPMATCCLPR